MRRLIGTGLVGLLLAAGCSGDDADSGTADDTASTSDEAGTTDGPTLGPLVSGSGSTIDGTFVWTDYVYDDRGPNLDGEPGGDATHPDGWRNEADLVQTQIGVDEEGRLTVRAVLETVTDEAVPVVLLALDTDQDPATGAADVGPWSPPDPVGAEHVAVLREGDGTLADAEGETEPLEVTVDREANVVEATLPLEPGEETWGVLVAAMPGDREEVSDLGLVGGEPEYRWQDDIQSDLLAGDGSTADAVQEIPFQVLADTDDQSVDAPSPGFHTYLYESELELGEGVAPAPEDGLEYRGRYQPYLVWIPDEGAEPDEPMTLFLHGLTQNHLGSVISPDGAYLGTGRPLSEEIGNLEQYAHDGLDFPPHNLTVWPLARGEGLRYEGIAEQDSLDVLADATERFQPDPDRIILSGGSMGGIGAFRLGALYPDLFSVTAPIIGLATEGTRPLLGNLWNLPVRQINGADDPLIPAAEAAATTDLLDELEVEYRAWMLDDRGHEAGGFVYDCVYESLPDFVRETAPPDVHYTVDPEQFVSDPASGLELSYDGAYWISGMEVADPAAVGRVDAYRLDGDGQASVARHIDRRGESGPDGGDLCGPNPDVSTGDTWHERGVVREPTPVPQHAPSVQVVLTNLAAVTVDLTASTVFDNDLVADQPSMSDEPPGVRVTSDGDAEVTLTGLPPGTTIVVSGEQLTASEDGVVSYAVPAGDTNATRSP